VDYDLSDLDHVRLPAARGALHGVFSPLRFLFLGAPLLVTSDDQHLARSVSAMPATTALVAEARFQA
jgi:hypothetical protein